MLEYYRELYPTIDDTAYVAPSAQVIGDVRIGKHSSIWPNVVARGDIHYIQIGDYTNIQDGSVLHVTPDIYPVTVGNHVTVGHMAMLHGCTIHDHALIGMGAILLDGSEVGERCIVAAGALVPERKKLKPGWLYIGSPVKPVRELNETAWKMVSDNKDHYVELAAEYLAALKKREK